MYGREMYVSIHHKEKYERVFDFAEVDGFDRSD